MFQWGYMNISSIYLQKNTYVKISVTDEKCHMAKQLTTQQTHWFLLSKPKIKNKSNHNNNYHDLVEMEEYQKPFSSLPDSTVCLLGH